MLPALLVLLGLFAVLLLFRVSAARRAELLARWPGVVLAVAALVALARGQVWFGLGLGLAAAIAWVMTPRRPLAPQQAQDPETAAARTILGVGANATESEIRAAYRAKMARAHPDRGGSHAEAARLTAARDRLLKRR